MKNEIVSIHNPRVKQWTQLLEKKGREKQGKFIVEGFHLVQEALESHAQIDCIAYSLEKGVPQDIVKERDKPLEWIGVSDAIMAKCTNTQTPQGIFAVVNKLSWDVNALLSETDSLVVVIDGVQDPGNLGTIIRSADAVKASGVIIGKGSVDLYNPKSVRSTMGSMFHLPIIECDLQPILTAARKGAIQLVNTSLQAETNCYEVDFKKGTWFIVGNEGQGVSAAVAPFVDKHIKIPMLGQAESLNVAMATTVLLYEALRQRNYT